MAANGARLSYEVESSSKQRVPKGQMEKPPANPGVESVGDIAIPSSLP